MAFLKLSTKPTPALNAAFAITPDVTESADALTVALDARIQIDAAIAKNATARHAADQSRRNADAEVERLDLELALAIDHTKIVALETALDAARMTAQHAVTAFDRATRLQSALYARAPEADGAIITARQTFQSALGAYSRVVNEALAIEARDAAQHIERVLRRAHATASAIGNLSQSGGFLGDILIPSPASAQPIITGSRVDGGDGTYSDLAADWRADAGASALAVLMKPLADLRRRASSHMAFTPPPPAAKPTEASSQNSRNGEFNKAADEREAARIASEPKQTPWAGQVTSFENNRHYSSR
jgi:hypothetical protein